MLCLASNRCVRVAAMKNPDWIPAAVKTQKESGTMHTRGGLVDGAENIEEGGLTTS